MGNRKLHMLILGVGLALAAGPAAAQRDEATIYRDANFSGPAIAVTQPQPNLGLRYPVRAIRVASGSWELCPEPNFRGRCLTVWQSSSNLARDYGWPGTLQSIRPVRGGGGGTESGGGISETLRGMASQYWPAPRSYENGTRGQRVLACPRGAATSQCAKDNANAFCRREGWNRSAHERMETEFSRNYLADVLCVRA